MSHSPDTPDGTLFRNDQGKWEVLGYTLIQPSQDADQMFGRPAGYGKGHAPGWVLLDAIVDDDPVFRKIAAKLENMRIEDVFQDSLDPTVWNAIKVIGKPWIDYEPPVQPPSEVKGDDTKTDSFEELRKTLVKEGQWPDGVPIPPAIDTTTGEPIPGSVDIEQFKFTQNQYLFRLGVGGEGGLSIADQLNANLPREPASFTEFDAKSIASTNDALKAYQDPNDPNRWKLREVAEGPRGQLSFETEAQAIEFQNRGGADSGWEIYRDPIDGKWKYRESTPQALEFDNQIDAEEYINRPGTDKRIGTYQDIDGKWRLERTEEERPETADQAITRMLLDGKTDEAIEFWEFLNRPKPTTPAEQQQMDFDRLDLIRDLAKSPGDYRTVAAQLGGGLPARQYDPNDPLGRLVPLNPNVEKYAAELGLISPPDRTAYGSGRASLEPVRPGSPGISNLYEEGFDRITPSRGVPIPGQEIPNPALIPEGGFNRSTLGLTNSALDDDGFHRITPGLAIPRNEPPSSMPIGSIPSDIEIDRASMNAVERGPRKPGGPLPPQTVYEAQTSDLFAPSATTYQGTGTLFDIHGNVNPDYNPALMQNRIKQVPDVYNFPFLSPQDRARMTDDERFARKEAIEHTGVPLDVYRRQEIANTAVPDIPVGIRNRRARMGTSRNIGRYA